MNEQGNHETVGRYRLIRKLARGGMAEVYLARSQGAHGFEKTVAIKKILPHFSMDEQFVRMMVDEAKISVLLNHPNVAQIFEFGEAEGEYFLVMEYVGGQSLSKLVKRMRKANESMNVLDACYIVMGLLQGLHGAHIQTDDVGKPARIIHRDVSPQNVLLSWNGHIKVIDFGIARARGRLERTEIGTIKGKLRYLAPEMIDPARFSKTKDFDHRVDIFAAGIVLYELIAGASLFTGENELEVYDAIMSAPFPDLSDRGLCERGLMKIIYQALSRDPDERYSSAEDFADDLRAHVYGSDANYKSRRIADLMNRYFSKEKDILERIEREGSAGALKAEREVNLTKTNFGGSSQASTRADRSGGTGSKRKRKPDEKPDEESENKLSNHPLLSDFEEGVTPDAETQLEFLSEDVRSETHATVPVPSDDGLVSNTENDSKLLAPATSAFDLSGTNGKRYLLIAAALLGIFLLVLVVFGVLYSSEPEEPIAQASPTSAQDEPVLQNASDTIPENAQPLAEDPAPADVGVAPEEVARVALVVMAKPEHAKVTRTGDTENYASPYVFLVDPESEIELRVSAEGYESVKQKVQAPAAGQKRVEFVLEPLPVALKLKGLPSGAKVTLDGKAIRSDSALKPGEHTLVVTKSKYETYRKTFRANAGENVELSIDLQKVKKRRKVARARKGTISIKTTPYWGQVKIDGKVIKQTTPVTVALSAGSHTVTVSHPPKGLVEKFTIVLSNGDKKTRTIKW